MVSRGTCENCWTQGPAIAAGHLCQYASGQDCCKEWSRALRLLQMASAESSVERSAGYSPKYISRRQNLKKKFAGIGKIPAK